MNKVLTICRFEYRLQARNPAAWAVLLLAVAVSLLESFPTRENLIRLEFLKEPAYFVYRTMNVNSLLLVLALVFLLGNRIPLDKKTGVIALLMAAPVGKRQYVLGKLLGGFCFAVSALALFLLINTGAYLLVMPGAAAALAAPLGKALLVSILPVGLFTACISVALPAVMDLRLFYLLAAVFLMINAATVGAADANPFYLVTSGDLIKLVWQHPEWPFVHFASACQNLVFLLGGGLLSCLPLIWSRKFWREQS